MCTIVGLDLGNRYAKTVCQDISDEFLISWKEVSSEAYETTESSETVSKVTYLGKHYVFGDVGEVGINERNKGESSVRASSNLVKLVMLGRLLQRMGKSQDSFKVVTGTPYDDYEKTQGDYHQLMLGKGEESLTIDGSPYQIRVADASISKQGACVILTLPERKHANYLIWDFGGETLDVSYFEKGQRITGHTMGFALNRIFVDLGKHLNTYIDIDRPSLHNARYQKSIETLIFTGKYKDVAVGRAADNTPIELGSEVHRYLQTLVDTVIAETIHSLDFNTSTLASLTNIFVGGGAKLLEKELFHNPRLLKKKMQEEPQFSNARAYYKIGTAREWM